jgi:hypothetical protein
LKILKEKDHSEDLGVDTKKVNHVCVVLNRSLKNMRVLLRTNFCGL